MSFYVAMIVVLCVTALGVLGCLAAAWFLAGKTWHDDSMTCPRCGQMLKSAGSCPHCGTV